MATRALESVDPTSGERIRAWPELDEHGLERALSDAHSAAARWARVAPE